MATKKNVNVLILVRSNDDGDGSSNSLFPFALLSLSWDQKKYWDLCASTLVNAIFIVFHINLPRSVTEHQRKRVKEKKKRPSRLN